MENSTDLSHLFGLGGKTALITGGSRGIGRSIAIALASAGANIYLLVRNPSSEDILETQSAILSLPHQPKCEIFACDLNNRWAVTHVIDFNFSWAEKNIDIVVHSGGIQHRSPAEDFPLDKWDEVLNVNLSSAFILSQSIAKHWLATCLNPSHAAYGPNNGQRKKIIFIASVCSFTGSVEIPAYSASKGAIAQLTKALNNEWMAKGINVNAIAPGYIQTELTRGIAENKGKEKQIMDRVPAGRWGLPDDIAGPVIYLASRASDFVGGEVHCVDGGFNGR